MGPEAAYDEAREELVVALAQRGEREAFASLVRRHQAWLRGLLRRLSGNSTLADDLAQQAFLLAWRDIEKLRDAKKFGGWLRTLALNTWRKHQRRDDPLAVSSAMAAAPEPASDGQQGLARDLDQALGQLKPDERLCIVLAHHQGMSHAEISAAIELPLGTVKSHIQRGAARLRELLADYVDDNGKPHE